ncbi:uncharacterized protein HMPREF1541_07092 [Cyphellophora europaea CBS 101466]|uniref:Cytochrome P450 oxidoreductase n=1 Tax=Cyphellophora europaea (strain CBS 101466) TaxID=1220924 RepID=W2RMD4_CYPE1|nr:uncharacterized protein HMPREF1541_07092 [Cyphellophora europaea CBS 101466]ETN37470.1 hypothetical protein HMPREF1541_07092 [Cyphellophora europaea CBS 101466]
MDTVLIALGLVATLLVLDYLRLSLWSPLRSIPGPFSTRSSGLYRLSMVYRGNAPNNYRELHKRYGKIVRTGPNHVSISDPSAIPTVYGLGTAYLKTPFYSTMSPFYKGSTMDSMFTTRDPSYHKALKTPVAQLFSMTNMRNYETYVDECSAIFVRSMKDLQGQSFDLAIWLQWYAFDVIASLTFQRRFGFMENRVDVDNMISGLDAGLRYVGVIGQYPGWHRFLMGNRILMETLATLIPNLPDPLNRFMQITEEEVQRYDNESKHDGRTDFLSQLRAKEAKDGKIPNRDMMNHLSNNLLAGSDTTAISLRACFYYIIRTPRVYKRLVEEIDEAHHQGTLSEFITYEECLKLPYLQATIKEAMRMHPGVAFPLERLVPDNGATLLGYHLPARTNVSMSAPVIHYDKEIFGPDSHEFRPERWLESNAERMKIMDRALLTFGYGARTCIGKNISIMEMGKFIPQILRNFEIEWASSEPEWKTYAAWFWKQSDIIVKFSDRHKTDVA